MLQATRSDPCQPMPNVLPDAAGCRTLLVKPGGSLDKPLLGLGGQAQAFRHKPVPQKVEPAGVEGSDRVSISLETRSDPQGPPRSSQEERTPRCGRPLHLARVADPCTTRVKPRGSLDNPLLGLGAEALASRLEGHVPVSIHLEARSEPKAPTPVRSIPPPITIVLTPIVLALTYRTAHPLSYPRVTSHTQHFISRCFPVA